MLRRKNLLISLAIVTLCYVGISPTKACNDWDLLNCHVDNDGNVWACWFNLIYWRVVWEYVGNWGYIAEDLATTSADSALEEFQKFEAEMGIISPELWP